MPSIITGSDAKGVRKYSGNSPPVAILSVRTGFTLLEVLLAVALMFIISSVTLILSLILLRTNDLDNAVATVTADLRRAQTLSRAGDRDGVWGVNIQSGSITVFFGNSFPSRETGLDQTTELPSTIVASGLTEVTFTKTTGLPSSAGVITLAHETAGTRRLFINTIGTIEEVASGQTMNLQSARDATLIQSNPTTNDGGGSTLQEYPRNIGYNKRFVLAFNLSIIPQTAVVTSATLKLKEAQTYGVARTVSLHRVTQPWTETSATWSTLASSFAPVASSSTSISWTGTLKWDQWDVTSDVQAFVSGSQPNYGWLVKDASEDTSEAYWYFSSREGATPPVLEVTYTL